MSSSVFPSLSFLFSLSILSGANAFANSDTFIANNHCSVLLSGFRVQNVRSVFLDCTQGALIWENPSGSLLATFSAPRQFRKSQICFRFPGPLPEGTTVERMAHSSQLLPISPSLSLHCFPSERIQLFIRIVPFYTNNNHSMTIYYAVEEVPFEGGERVTAHCGLCAESLFLDHFCSANFVFIGKLLQHSPASSANGLHQMLDFSTETPLIRRPLLLTHIAQENGQFNSTTLLFANCPSAQSQLRPSIHTKYVVVANAQLGFARLLCLFELSKFQQIPPESAPCDINLLGG